VNDMKCTEVAVLRGGPSSEYEVSLKTGAGVIEALMPEAVCVRDVIITRAGEWMVGGFVKTPEQALAGVDVAFIALHGAYGEDGTVQRMLERMGVPYTGSGPYASALAMNKVLTKEFLKSHGVRMPQHLKVLRDGAADVRQTALTITQLFGPEYVVKPVSGGSSIDTVMVGSYADLVTSLEDILSRVDTVMVEERIRGREATVGVLEQYRNDPHYVMPVIEIVPPSRADFFSADVKYTGETEEICPGRFTASERDALLRAARSIHKALGLRHYSRSDFMVTDTGAYFLEVNTLPGLTAQSLFPKAIDAVGGSYRELVLHLLKLATNDV
jgi:D-alanine-D-alanine ligase